MSKRAGKLRKEQKLSGEVVRQLITEKQQQLGNIRTPVKKNQKSSRIEVQNDEQMQEDEELNISLEEVKVANVQKISILISQLIAKNKINAKNAFDVPLIQITQTKDFNYQLTGDNSWKKLSSTLQSNNKIYGYRVDATHNHTYKVLQLLTRKEKQLRAENEQEQVHQKNYMGQTIAQFCEMDGEGILSKYLQKNYKGINILHLQMFFNVNPILEKTKRIFDQQGLSGLLLNNVQMQKDLTLNLNYQFANIQQKDQQPNKQNTIMEEDQFDGYTIDAKNIFEVIHRTCNIYNIIQNNQEEILIKEEENDIMTIWKELQQLVSPPIICPVIQSFSPQPDPIIILKLVQSEENCGQQNVFGQNKEDIIDKKLENDMLMSEKSQIIATENLQTHIQEINNEVPVNSPNILVVQQNKPALSQNDHQTSPNAAEIQVIPIIEMTFPVSGYLLNQQNISIRTDNQDLSLPISNLSLKTDSTGKSKEIPISSEIKINHKLNLTMTDIIKQIDGQQDNQVIGELLVEKWKNADKIPKKIRKPRVHKEQSQILIDFSFEETNSAKKRKDILKEDKQKKLQLKRYLKGIQNQINREKNIYFDTSKWNRSYSHSLLLNENPLQRSVQPQIVEQVSNSALNISNLSNFVNLVLEEKDIKTMRTMSLREVKQRVTNFIFQEKTKSFADLYNSFVRSEGFISPALCFLTVLHLANQHNLSLSSQNQSDIKIVVQVTEVQQ